MCQKLLLINNRDNQILFIIMLFYCVNSGTTARSFISHDKDVLSVAFSADNRQIVSGAMDNSIKLWNTLGVCKYTITVGIISQIFKW